MLYKSLKTTTVYKRALMDRRLLSKILSDKNYQPSKDTAIALCFALHLSLNQAVDLLNRAGYALSHSILRDIIIVYFLKNYIYDLNKINSFLYSMNEKIIGKY